MLNKCETCDQPLIGERSAFTAQLDNIKAQRAGLEATHADLLKRQAAGQLEGNEGIKALWPILDGWTALENSLRGSMSDVRQRVTHLRWEYNQKFAAVVKEMTTTSRPGEYNTRSEHYGERSAIYNLKVADEHLAMLSAEELLGELQSLQDHLKWLYEHWKDRGYQIRWLAGRVDGPSAPLRR